VKDYPDGEEILRILEVGPASDGGEEQDLR
jgi:hypothetical protein